MLDPRGLYEFFIGWRYLFRRSDTTLGWKVAAVSGLCALIGAVLFFVNEYHIIGAVMMTVGIIAFCGGVLAQFFSAFTVISVLGLAFGVATLIWVLGVTSGFHDAFREKVLGVNAHVIVLKYGVDFSEYRDVMKSAGEIPGVEASAPFAFNEMMLAKGNRLSGVLVKGVEPDTVGKVLDLPRYIDKSDTDTASPDLTRLLTTSKVGEAKQGVIPGLIVGRELAKKIDAKVGDYVRLVSPLSTLESLGWSGRRGGLPRARDFRISAIFYSGFSEYDRRLVYAHLSEVQSFYSQGDVVTGVELKTFDMFGAKQIARTLESKLATGIYRVVDWSELNRNLFTALQTQKVVLQLLIGFLVLVASFNVLAALAVLVLRKTREIAILKSMGMSRAGVARVFQSAGLIVWFFGTLVGLSWGYIGAVALRHYRFPLDPKVYLISELPVRLDPFEFIATAGFALLVCVIATFYPSKKAARLDPVDGLRFH